MKNGCVDFDRRLFRLRIRNLEVWRDRVWDEIERLNEFVKLADFLGVDISSASDEIAEEMEKLLALLRDAPTAEVVVE